MNISSKSFGDFIKYFFPLKWSYKSLSRLNLCLLKRKKEPKNFDCTMKSLFGRRKTNKSCPIFTLFCICDALKPPQKKIYVWPALILFVFFGTSHNERREWIYKQHKKKLTYRLKLNSASVEVGSLCTASGCARDTHDRNENAFRQKSSESNYYRST